MQVCEMRISSTCCEDILNVLRGYPQHAARISSTYCKEFLNTQYRDSGCLLIQQFHAY